MRGYLVIVLALLPLGPLNAQRLTRWAVNLGYNYATYPGQQQHYSGIGMGLQIPLGGPVRLGARWYDQGTSDDFFSDGYAIDLGLQVGLGNRVGEINLLAGMSLSAVGDDYVSGGLATHYGAMARLWVVPNFGLYAEWIRRPVSGWSRRQTGLGIGVTIRQWP